jgi:hypothetical protein
MENITLVEKTDEISGEVTQHIIIDNGDGSFTSMLKSTWDELEAQKELGGTL